VPEPFTFRLGIITWKGDALRNGYPMRFGNKYVELDSEVSSDDLPNVSGLATNLDDNTPPDDLPSPHWLAKAIRRDDGANSSQPVPAAKHGSKFITPASFYALPQPKPKASLYVSCRNPVHFRTDDDVRQGMTPTQKARWL
jgi:hypothetical protein